jgi:pimeloyl-ACP methyl ester carboxylesterase
LTTAPSTESGGGTGAGLELYYERTGAGPPLVLLHGAFGTIESCFAELRPRLARRFEVIAVELEGHGRTAALPRPLTYEQMAQDTAALIDRLGIAPAHVVGYSTGGAVGMQLALTRPQLVDRLVQFGGVSFSHEGNHPEPTDAGDVSEMSLLESLENSRWHRAYVDVAPDPHAWPRLVEMVAKVDDSFGWTPQEVEALSRPTLLVNGDADVTTLEHVVEMFRHLGGGGAGEPVPPSQHQLAILPGTTHVGMLDRVDWLESIICEFLTCRG